LPAELSFLLSGIIFGLSGGFTPGPLTTLVISQSLRYGVGEGCKIALAPILTDLPIVLVTTFIVSQLSEVQVVLGIISILGGLFLVYLGYESFTFKGAEADFNSINPDSFKKGMIANFLNPSPYVFWFTIGSPTVMKAWNINLISVVLFIVGMYFCLVGSKILIAIIVGKSRVFLKSKNYIYTIRILGIILLIFAMIFFKDGLQSFDLI